MGKALRHRQQTTEALRQRLRLSRWCLNLPALSRGKDGGKGKGSGINDLSSYTEATEGEKMMRGERKGDSHQQGTVAHTYI